MSVCCKRLQGSNNFLTFNGLLFAWASPGSNKLLRFEGRVGTEFNRVMVQLLTKSGLRPTPTKQQMVRFVQLNKCLPAESARSRTKGHSVRHYTTYLERGTDKIAGQSAITPKTIIAVPAGPISSRPWKELLRNEAPKPLKPRTPTSTEVSLETSKPWTSKPANHQRYIQIATCPD